MIHVAPLSSSVTRRLDAEARPAIAARAAEGDGAERSVFETAAYRRAYGIREILRAQTEAGTLTFDDRGDHAVCLARSAALGAHEIEQACAALFADARLRFAVFEDIANEEQPRRWPSPLRFRYQSDWVVPFGHEDRGMRPSFRRKVEKKLRLLQKDHDGTRLVIEPSPSRATVEQAICLSRKKIEASGRTYLIDESEMAQLAELFASVGTAAVLYHGDHIVSCDLFVEHGLDAYAFLGGYDMAYARRSPGQITVWRAMEHFEARGFRAGHLLWGDGAYKAEFGAEPVALTTLVVPRDAGAFLNPRLLGFAGRLGKLHARERLRERPWLGDPLRRALHRVRGMRTLMRGG